MMKIFSWVTKDTTIEFMKARKLTYVLSFVMVVLSIASIAIKGFNYGIDFSGGIFGPVLFPDQLFWQPDAHQYHRGERKSRDRDDPDDDRGAHADHRQNYLAGAALDDPGVVGDFTGADWLHSLPR